MNANVSAITTTSPSPKYEIEPTDERSKKDVKSCWPVSAPRPGFPRSSHGTPLEREQLGENDVMKGWKSRSTNAADASRGLDVGVIRAELGFGKRVEISIDHDV